jgi:uncharacterized membrane protein HdeD (DUF308 family)
MTTVETPSRLGHLWKAMLLTGIVTLVLGALVLGWPKVSILTAAVLFGIYLLASGIAEMVFAFSLPVSAPYRVMLFITGALSMVLGVLAFRHFGEGYAVLLLAIWIGVGFLFQGVAETATAISYRELPGRGWHIFFGLLSMAAGVVVLAWPYDSIWTLAIVTGAWFVVIGITEIVAALVTRKDLKKAEKELSQIPEGAPTKAA